jgi:hypothetical protein
MGRSSRWHRSARGAAILISLALGTGCLAWIAKSAADWAALAKRYSDVANRGGMCSAGASDAAAAGAAAGRAHDAAEIAGLDLAMDRPPADPDVLVRVRELADAAVPNYNAALPAIAAAVENSPDNVVDNILLKSLGTVVGEGSFVAADALSGGATLTLHVFGAVADIAGWIDLAEGPGDEIRAAAASLDAALGSIEAGQLELLQMHRRQSPDGVAGSATLERIQALRRQLAEETNLETQDLQSAVLNLGQIAERVAREIIGLQQEVEFERARSATLEAAAGNAGVAIHEAEQTAREEAEQARVAAEAALTACGVAFDWGLGDPLDATFDQDESNQGGYTIPSPGPPPPIPGP